MSAERERQQRAWDAVGRHANAPELIAMREAALSRVRRGNARRWLGANPRRAWLAAASTAGAVLVLAAAWQLSPYGYRPGLYVTGLGEQRVVELEDHSRIALDAQTRLRVRFTDDVRAVTLASGQAQFSVARDPARPFRVEAGDRAIVAIGTAFTVEYVDQEVRVALLEGRVAVSSTAPEQAPVSRPIELNAGEALRVAENGVTTVIPKADLEAATAWRQGKVIFHAEPLGEAIRRLNRYSKLQLVIDDAALATLRVSGVFEAGDSQAFAEAIEAYLPVSAEYAEPGVVRLIPQ
jgi:transmembrane sensor